MNKNWDSIENIGETIDYLNEIVTKAVDDEDE